MSVPNRRTAERTARQRPDASKLGTLEQRLNDGYERIEQAMARGEDVNAWESFWIDLLAQYEESFTVLPGLDAVPNDKGNPS